MPKHTLYFSEKMFEKLDIDTGGVEGLSSRVSSLCDQALEVLRDNIPPMLEREWMTFLDVLNGIIPPTEHGPRAVVDAVHFSILCSGPECDAKWDVSCVDLAAKYKGLPLVQQLAVVEVCRRFWVRRDIAEKFSSYRDILAAHGAKFEDKG